MTDEAKQAARERAKVKELEGYWLTLDFPSYDAVISYADNRALRREVYEAYVTRASDRGPQAGQFDNSALMEDILALRPEMRSDERRVGTECVRTLRSRWLASH